MSSFRFKQFTVKQDAAAMKVGTDSILLGSWVALTDEDSILDIGTGTGLLALMLAQRSNATTIDAVEIEGESYVESVLNFENSPWADRLFCYHSSIQEFAKEIEEKYDIIVANPPYFNPSQIVSSRSIARQTHLLTHMALLKSTAHLLNKGGVATFIVPFEISDFFIKLAQNLELFVQRIMHVKDTDTAVYKRSLLAFSFEKKITPLITSLALKNADQSYTVDFKKLTQDFYLD